MKLTKSVIDKLQYEGESKAGKDGKEYWDACVYWDKDLPSFGVRVYPSGKKSFMIAYRHNGRLRRMVLGSYGVVTLDQARKMARQKLSEVLSGGDPLEKKSQAQRGESVEALCRAFLEQHAKRHKRSWAEDERRIHKHIVPAMGRKKVENVKRSDIVSFHNRLGEKHPYEANRVLALLSVIFEFGRKNGFLPEDHVNPARGIEKFREQKRDRWVKPDELPRLIEAIEAADNIYVRAALWLYLLTGLRKHELLRAEWKDVDLERRELRLPSTKSGRTHYVPLSTAAVEALKGLPREEGNSYLLPGRKPGHHLVNIDIPWRKIRTAAGLEDVRLHDLRRTVGSWLATAGHSLHIVGKILGHADVTTTAKVYAHLGPDPLTAAIEEHGEKILSITRLRDRVKEDTA